MTLTTFRIPKATIGVTEQGGIRYLDSIDLELWLRRIADSLQTEGAPEIAAAIVIGIADQLAKEPT